MRRVGELVGEKVTGKAGQIWIRKTVGEVFVIEGGGRERKRLKPEGGRSRREVKTVLYHNRAREMQNPDGVHGGP